MNTELVHTIAAVGSPAHLLQQELDANGYDLEAWTELEGESYVRAIVGSAWFSSTGLVIPAGATEADLLIAMRASRTMHTSDAWMRGDIVNWIRDNRYGGGDIPRTEMVKLAHELGVANPKRLLNNATTARCWPIGMRHPSNELSYSHHEELNALPAAEKVAWAQRAITEGLSIAALRLALQEDAASISVETEADGVTTTEQVSFASEKLDKGRALRTIATSITNTAVKQAGKNLTAAAIQHAAETVLTAYLKEGLLRLPARAWADAWAVHQAAPAQNGAAPANMEQPELVREPEDDGYFGTGQDEEEEEEEYDEEEESA